MKHFALRRPAEITAVRLLFLLFYGSQGVLFSFLVVYYYSTGMSGAQIGLINTVTPLVSMATGILWSLANDRLGRTRVLLLAAITGSALFALGLGAVRPFGWILLMAASMNFFYRPITPILDSVALATLGAPERDRYGRVRLWGAVGYSLAALAAGYILTRTGVGWVFTGFALALALMAAAVFLLPDRPVSYTRPRVNNLLAFVTNPDWMVFILCAAFIWLNDIGYNTFLPVYLKQMGASETTIGSVNAVQSLSEAVFLFFSVFFLLRFRLENLMVAAMFFYTLRPLLYSFIPSPQWAIPLALLHSVSFGLYIVCVVNFIFRISPEGFKTTGQGLYYAMHYLVMAFGSWLHGWLFDTFGAVRMLRIDTLFGLVGLGLFVLYFLSPRRRSQLPGR